MAHSGPPTMRKLQVFAFDPSLGTRLSTVDINTLTLEILWEKDPITGEGILEPGPVGEYIEVVDYDPASGVFYDPVDLNDRFVLAENGLTPSEGNPQFHQQMVYAVAMQTIDHFERALGRVALWSDRVERDSSGKFVRTHEVRRLRIYPHALREANAYYSPEKKSLLFGYFPSRGVAPRQMPRAIVHTCLSHDIIAHETTHALLDGIHPRFIENTNSDVHALHEAFADIVAIFQRFSHSSLLRHQIAATRGNLDAQNLLAKLAQEFGLALGSRGSLRDALGRVDEQTGEWRPIEPDPAELERTHEPHDRGAILVAAVFRAYLDIYKSRSEDLFRIATSGTGVLPDGAIHPDLVGRLAEEASRAAAHVLKMCVRALDYCPPVDITFGEYLRAIITADVDLHPDDQYNYRVAFVEAFRAWGIFPEEVRSLSVDSLAYSRFDNQIHSERAAKQLNRHLKKLFAEKSKGLSVEWDLRANRSEVRERMRQNAKIIHHWLVEPSMKSLVRHFGLTLNPKAPASVFRKRGEPTIEVHSVRTAQRSGPRGTVVTDLVVELCQRRRAYFDRERQKQVDKGKVAPKDNGDFTFRRGCTLLIDASTHQIRYVIRNRGTISDTTELNRIREYLLGDDRDPDSAFASHSPVRDPAGEDFSIIHRH